MIGEWPFLESQRASFPVDVVLPEPCRPTIMYTLGGSFAVRRRAWCWPSILTISSRTILTTCWVGERAVSTSWPMDFSLTASMNCCDLEMDVRLEQRQANLLQRGLHVFGREFPLAAQVLEDPLEFI